MAPLNSGCSSDTSAAGAMMMMDESSPSSLLYRRRLRPSPRLEPVPDYGLTAPHHPEPSQPPSTPTHPIDDGYYSRHRPSLACTRNPRADYDPSRQQMEDGVHSDFVRDGWSPEPPSREARQPAGRPPAILDMSFLEFFPPGNVTISYSNGIGDVARIHGICQTTIEARSFLLSQAVEGNCLHLECCTSVTIRPFLQYVYTSTYHLPTATGELLEDVPTSLLVHCQMFRLGDIYDIPDLKSFANMQIIRQCEFGCSSPDPPVDLCAAIDYIYNHMREYGGVIETIVTYCVTSFLGHGLGDNFEFRKLAYDLRPFHQDLCKVGMERRFEDNHTAQAIIQMPFEPYAPMTYASREDDRAQQIFDDVYHFHGDLAHKPQRLPTPHILADGTARPRSTGASEKCDSGGHDLTVTEEGLDKAITKQKQKIRAECKAQGLSLRQKRQLPRLPKLVESQNGSAQSRLEGSRMNAWHPYGRLETYSVPAPGAIAIVEATGQTQSMAKQQVAFAGVPDGLVPKPRITADKEPKVGVSRELFNGLVSAGLTGKSGRRADLVSRPQATDKVRELCAALAKEELETARADAEYEVVPAAAARTDCQPESESDSDFVKIEPGQAQASDIDVQLESGPGTTLDVGSASDSDWDMV